MAKRSLTIDVKPTSVPVGTQDQWTVLPRGFINDIETPQLAKGINIGQLVSGIPSAFARVDLFKTAIDYSSSAVGVQTGTRNLVSYYEMLVDEWRGLIACLALDYAHISVRSVDLRYSDGKDIKDTKNVYEPKGAFGNMLLKREPRWCEQNLAKTDIATPYINIIKYRGQVVGATSPESLLFTSTGYKVQHTPDCPWVDSVTGKFIDPLDAKMTEGQFVSLHAYVAHLLKSIDKVESYFDGLEQELKVDYKSIRNALDKWKKEINDKALATYPNIDFTLGSTPPVSAEFRGPFKDLFCYEDILWGLEGVISDDYNQHAIKFDPKKVLLDESSKIVQLGLNIKPEELDKLPILVLSADIRNSTKNDKAYFALPLSAQGLDVFGKNIAALVGMAGTHAAIASTMSAVYDPNIRVGNLEIKLTLKTTSGAIREYKKIYTSDYQVNNKDILLWPNFISPQWNAYYMYSEMPHNGKTGDYQAFPFVGSMQDNYFRILKDDDNKPLFLSKGGEIVSPTNKVDAQLLVKTDDSIASNPYKYEIYKSNKPFKGVCFKSPVGSDGGYILVNYSVNQGSDLPRDWMNPGARPNLQEVTLGVDFGSTNTSIAFSNDQTQGEGFTFKNHRVSLMGYELPGRPIIPRENQVFFFQGYGCEIQSNSIKSVLTLHDPCRLANPLSGQTTDMRNEQAVVGGFPSFSDNLPFQGATSSRITLNFPNGVGQVTQVHNMKWEDTSDAKAQKSAFLRTLMLHVYATLFEMGYVPTKLRWSYPSAMKGSLLHSYQLIWNGLSNNLSPVTNSQNVQYGLTISQPIGVTIKVPNGIGFGSADDNASAGFANQTQSNDFGSFGGFGTSDSGFGSSAGFGGFGSSTGFGDNGDFSSEGIVQQVSSIDLRPDSTDGVIEFIPKPLLGAGQNSNVSLSEAEAVANHISVKYATSANELNLCFDVGGSTTDISALFLLRGVTGSQDITMVKQNSIRFAAQRISQAVGNFPQFENVLKQICAQYDISMVGLNMGPNSYNKETAPYFFDQIVNRLDAQQLNALYGLIAANCPNLMVLNMYVTGLLMFYAGQLSHKLVDDLKRTSDAEWPAKRRPLVRVTFAGKGARLFQWIASVNSAGADQYYREMFILGYGETHMKQTLINYPHIILPKFSDTNVKYEVSMGLAKDNTALQRPSVDQPAEIIGESGWQVVGNDMQSRDVQFTNSITPDMMSRIGVDFRAGANAVKFTDFCGLFYAAAHQLFGWSANPAALQNSCASLAPVRYAQNMPEFIEARNDSSRTGEPFSFVAPIIIIEGMQFYDESLLKHL